MPNIAQTIRSYARAARSSIRKDGAGSRGQKHRLVQLADVLKGETGCHWQTIRIRERRRAGQGAHEGAIVSLAFFVILAKSNEDVLGLKNRVNLGVHHDEDDGQSDLRCIHGSDKRKITTQRCG